jgi:hypothetical protein
VPVYTLTAELGIRPVLLRTWCRWDHHPALGRSVRSGIGPCEIEDRTGRKKHWRGLLVSHKDARACVAAFRDPLHFRFPNIPGVWLAEGIFRHDDQQLWFSDRYLEKHRLRLPRFGLAHPCYRDRLDQMLVPWPGQGHHHRWSVRVSTERSVDALLLRHKGEEDDGRWLEPGRLWRDAEGLWYSSAWIAAYTGKAIRSMFDYLRGSGLVSRYKTVPMPRKRGGRLPVVHHASEVDPLLGFASAEESPARYAARPQGRAILVPSAASILGEEESRDSLGSAAEPKPYPTLIRNDSTHPVPVTIVNLTPPHGADPDSPPAPASDLPRVGKARKRGRPRSQGTEEVMKLCYDLYILAGATALQVRSCAKARFGEEISPKEDSHVREYASRYAERHGLATVRPDPP